MREDIKDFINGLTHSLMIAAVNYSLGNLDKINFGIGNVFAKIILRKGLTQLQKILEEKPQGIKVFV